MPPFFRLAIGGGRSLRKPAGNGGAAPDSPSVSAGLFCASCARRPPLFVPPPHSQRVYNHYSKSCGARQCPLRTVLLLVCGGGRLLMSPFSKSVFYRILTAQKGRVQYDQCHIRNFYLYAFCNTDFLLAARGIVSIMRFGRNYLWKIGLKDYAMKLIKSFLSKNQIVSVCISLICTALHDFAHCWL